MPRTARQILTRAIRDIEEGHWKKGTLIEDGPGAPSESIPTKKCDVYMGCALGLIAMHGGHGSEIMGGEYFRVEYPHDNAPVGVQKAVRALHAAVPSRYVGEYDDLSTVEGLGDSIVRYNDADSTTARKAANWFKKALANL